MRDLNLNEFEKLMYTCAPYLRGGSKNGTPLKLPDEIKAAKIKIPKTEPMDDEWKVNQAKMFWWGNPDMWSKEDYKKENELRERLIAIGGENAAVNDNLDDEIPLNYKSIDLILNYGQLLYSGYNAVINPFTNYINRHELSLKFHLANKKSTKLCYGYTLSEDGLWRDHSWILLMGKNNIIECTPIRGLVYYGVVLPDIVLDSTI